MKKSTDVSYLTPLLEATAVDKDKGIYEVTLLAEGLTIDKRRYYPRKTLEAAVPLFEGIRAFADHPTESEMKERPERSIRDLIGAYHEPQLVSSNTGTRIRAKLHTIESAGWVRPILDMACENPKLAGASIHADGTVTPKGHDGADLVESIDVVVSTDIVTEPNAGGKVERMIASNRKGGEEEMEFDELTIEQLREKRPDLLEEVTEDIKKKLKEEQEKADKENKDDEKKDDKDEGDKEKEEAKEQVESLRKKLESEIIGRKIRESEILETIKDDKDREKVREDLVASLEGKDEEGMDKVLESRKAFMKTVGAEVKGNPPKDDGKKEHKIGSILGEAKAAERKLKLAE